MDMLLVEPQRAGATTFQRKRRMTEQEKIDAIAKAISAKRNSPPSSGDVEFATKFLAASESMKSIESMQVTQGPGQGGSSPTGSKI